VDPLGWHIRKAEANVYLDGIAARLNDLEMRTEKALVEGQTAERIIEFAVGRDIGLIMLSSHGRSGLSGWNISSVVQKIILRAFAPVMIVRAYQPAANEWQSFRYRRLLVPLDGSQRAECILPLATTLTRFHQSQLLLAHLVCRPEMPRRAPLTAEETELVDRITERNVTEATRYLEGLCSRLSPEVETRLLVTNNVAASLHDVVEDEEVDLVALSAHGYSGRAKWPYGSVALNFIAYGTTPLLIVQDLGRDEVEDTQAELAARERTGH
jgi:nucleotide-binding universal stress UspA family protein